MPSVSMCSIELRSPNEGKRTNVTSDIITGYLQSTKWGLPKLECRKAMYRGTEYPIW